MWLCLDRLKRVLLILRLKFWVNFMSMCSNGCFTFVLLNRYVLFFSWALFVFVIDQILYSTCMLMIWRHIDVEDMDIPIDSWLVSMERTRGTPDTSILRPLPPWYRLHFFWALVLFTLHVWFVALHYVYLKKKKTIDLFSFPRLELKIKVFLLWGGP